MCADRREGTPGRFLDTLSTPVRLRAAGLTIESEIALPGLPETADRNVDVRFGPGDLEHRDGLTLRAQRFGCTAIGGTRVAVSVWIEPEGDVVPRTVLPAGLTGIAYQRGLLPLHAAAVQVAGSCIAFCGSSGAGKSTLASAFGRAGYPILSDDLLVVHPSPRERMPPVAWPGPSRSRLDADSVSLLGEGVVPLTPFSSWDGKTLAAIGPAPVDAPYPIAALYLLRWGELGVSRLSPLKAAAMLPQCLRKPGWLEESGRATSIRQLWLDLVARVPVLLLSRPRGTPFPLILSAVLEACGQGREERPPLNGDRSHP